MRLLFRLAFATVLISAPLVASAGGPASFNLSAQSAVPGASQSVTTMNAVGRPTRE